MNELWLGTLGVVLGCSFGLAGIFLGVRYSNARSFGRLSKQVYMGIASGVMFVIVFPALMFRVVFHDAAWVNTRLWIALAALALVFLMPLGLHWWTSRKS